MDESLSLFLPWRLSIYILDLIEQLAKAVSASPAKR